MRKKMKKSNRGHSHHVNQFGGICDLCSKWVYAFDGMRRKPGFKKRNKWTVRHNECHVAKREKDIAKHKAKKDGSDEKKT